MSCLLLITAVFGLTRLVPSALACSCVGTSLRDAYCSPRRTNYLIQGKVVNKSEVFVASGVRQRYGLSDSYQRYVFLQNNGMIRYVLSVTDVYVLDGRRWPFQSNVRIQGTRRFVRVGQNVNLRARIGESICGVTLELGKTYVLGGTPAGKRLLTTGLCYYKAGYDSRQRLRLPRCRLSGLLGVAGSDDYLGSVFHGNTLFETVLLFVFVISVLLTSCLTLLYFMYSRPCQ